MNKEDVIKFLNANMRQPLGNGEVWSGSCVKNHQNYVGFCVWGYNQHRGLIHLNWINKKEELKLQYNHIDLDDFEDGSQYIDELYELLLKFQGWWNLLVNAEEENEPLLMKQIQKEFDTLKDFYD